MQPYPPLAKNFFFSSQGEGTAARNHYGDKNVTNLQITSKKKNLVRFARGIFFFVHLAAVLVLSTTRNDLFRIEMNNVRT